VLKLCFMFLIGKLFLFYLKEGNWQHWKVKVEDYNYPKNFIPEFSSILVPNVDNVRTQYLIKTIGTQSNTLLVHKPHST